MLILYIGVYHVSCEMLTSNFLFHPVMSLSNIHQSAFTDYKPFLIAKHLGMHSTSCTLNEHAVCKAADFCVVSYYQVKPGLFLCKVIQSCSSTCIWKYIARLSEATFNQQVWPFKNSINHLNPLITLPGSLYRRMLCILS